MVPNTQAEPSKPPPEQINVTLNWFEELKQRVRRLVIDIGSHPI